jgi:hypothetical protein
MTNSLISKRAAGRGVVVLGMHRSGTSAVTGLLNLLGVPLPDKRYLVGRGRFNPKGFFEIQPLNLLNESLLRALGGDWSAPPRLEPGWMEDPRVRPFVRRGRRLFARVMPPDAWLWKDPRLCLTLPLWRQIVEEPPIVFLVLRNPLEVSTSLQGRNGFSHELALALWERYTADAATVAEGSAVAVVEYQSVVEDPHGWCAEARSWLMSQGVRCEAPAPAGAIMELIDPGLRHASRTTDDVRADPVVSVQQRELLAALQATVGYHDAFVPPVLPGRTTSATAVIEERRRGREGEGRGKHWRKRVASRAARLVQARR